MQLTSADTNKTVKLRNGQFGKIISVIKEYGHVCMVVGKLDDGTIAMWSDSGTSEVPYLDIVETVDV